MSLLLQGLGTRIWTLDLYKRQPNSSTSDRWRPDTPSSPQCFPVVGSKAHFAWPQRFSKGEGAAERKAARRGLPRPMLGSTLTLILVASLFVT